MGRKRQSVGPRWVGYVLFFVMLAGSLLFQEFHGWGPTSEGDAGDTSVSAVAGLIILVLCLFAVIVIGAAIFVWLKRDPVIFKAYRISNDGRPDEALEMLRRKMATRPKGVRAAAMGWILNRADRFAEAADAFAHAESIDPKTVSFTVERAVAMSKSGQGEAALAHLQQLSSTNPTEGGYILAVAAVLDEIGRPGEAREQFRRAEDLLSQYPRAFHA